MRRPGIHFRLLFPVFLLIGATTFSLGYIGVKFTHDFVQTRFEERIMFLARYLALNAELGILIDERAMLERLAANLLSEKDVVRVAIYNSFGRALADESKDSAGAVSVAEVPVVMREALEESRTFQWGIYREPFDETIGKVEITYSTEGINKLLTAMKIRYFWLAFGLSFASAFLFYFVSRSLVAPVTLLAQAARKIEKGDVQLRAEPGDLPEIRELTLAFNAMLDSLERSRRALERADREMIRQKTLAELGKFSLIVAHEVKNPLSIIKSSLDILKRDLENPSENTMALYIEDEVKRLNRLIEDFLLFARPASPNMREMDANRILGECVRRFEIQLTQGPVSIEYRIPETESLLQGDPDLLARAFANVVKNAIEAGDGEENRVVVTSREEEGAWIAEVEDCGPGVAEENRERIFDPFFTTRSKGTGLGLAFVAQVVAAHGGEVSVSDRESGPGAVFRIVLPSGGGDR